MLPTDDQVRLTNLAYRKMQKDFRVFAKDLFRTSESYTTDSNGYILLDTDAQEVELIFDANNTPLAKIAKANMNNLSGWYHDGIDTTTGKRRIMVRSGGNPKTSTAYTVHYTKEYPDLSDTSNTPYPFVSKAYLDMIATLAAHYYYAEQGKEKIEDSGYHWDKYQQDLRDARKDFLDSQASYGSSSHADSGAYTSSPTLSD